MGRIKDKIPFNDAQYKASDFETAILEGVENCIGYQIIIDRNSNGTDTLEIKLEMDKSVNNVDVVEKRVIDNFKEKFNTVVSVNFEDELNPIIFTGAMVSWKAARIIDKRSTRFNSTMEVDSAHRMIKQGVVKTV